MSVLFCKPRALIYFGWLVCSRSHAMKINLAAVKRGPRLIRALDIPPNSTTTNWPMADSSVQAGLPIIRYDLHRLRCTKQPTWLSFRSYMMWVFIMNQSRSIYCNILNDFDWIGKWVFVCLFWDPKQWFLTVILIQCWYHARNLICIVPCVRTLNPLGVHPSAGPL